MRALVTGATGAIGPVIVGTLLEKGYLVRVLARDSASADILPDNVEFVTGDITDPTAVTRAMIAVDYVFHLAAKLHVINPPAELGAEYRRVNVDGTRLVMNAAAAAEVKRVVFFSTIAVYGPSRPGELLDENSPARSDTLYALSKREAESIVLSPEYSRNSEPLGVVLRLAAVYGARIKGNYNGLVNLVRRGLVVRVGKGQNRRTLVHETDVARAAIAAAEHDSAAGRVFNVTDGTVHTFADIVDAIALAVGSTTRRAYVPISFARAAARVIDVLLKSAGRPTRVLPLIDKMTEDAAVSGEQIQIALGFRAKTDLVKGWFEAIRAS